NSSVVHGPTKRSVFCNKAALELFGFTSEEFNEFLTTGNTSQCVLSLCLWYLLELCPACFVSCCTFRVGML
ncbi:MAG: hypothetical protein P4L40_12245, partial [Terracidiphilus sp.]|nr:hypothetical protein [Terracidiphilus sp.]